MSSTALTVLALSGCNDIHLATVTDSLTDPTTTTDTIVVDTGTTTTTTTPKPVGLSELSWRLHDEVRSFVYVSWTQDVAGEVTVDYQLQGEGSWVASPTIMGRKGTNEQLIAGIPYGHTADYRVVSNADEATGKEPIVTGQIPAGMQEATVSVSKTKDWYQDGLYVIAPQRTTVSIDDYYNVIHDREGRLIWALPSADLSHGTRISQSGDHILYDTADEVVRRYLDEQFDEISTQGKEESFVELPDGTISWTRTDPEHNDKTWPPQIYGELVETAPDGTETVVWRCAEDFPDFEGQFGVNLCWVDNLDYDAVRDTYLLNIAWNDVVEVDASTGETLWWFGQSPDSPITFDPPLVHGASYESVSYTASGNLLIAEAVRDYDDFPPVDYGRVREYAIDANTHTLTRLQNIQIQQHRGNMYIRNSAVGLPNGGVLYAEGELSTIHEFDANGNRVWQLNLGAVLGKVPQHRLNERAVFIEDLYGLLSPDETVHLL